MSDPIVHELYKDSLYAGMWEHVHLIELYCKVYGNIKWDTNRVYDTANDGYAKVFYWLWENQHINVIDIPANIYIKGERYLGYKLDSPGLIYVDNVPKTSKKIIAHVWNYKIGPAVFGRILKLAEIDWWDILEDSMAMHMAMHMRYGGRLSSQILQLLDLIYAYVSPQLVSIDSYQSLVELCSKCKSGRHKVNKKIVDMCKNLTITVDKYREYDGSSEDISGYCGIMASGYNEKIINLVCDEDGDIFMLCCAADHRHKEMFELVYRRMRLGLIP
jgi:hypothetical protein